MRIPIRIGFGNPEAIRIFVRLEDGSVREYGHVARLGVNWPSVEAFDQNLRGNLVITSVDVYADSKIWVTLEKYPGGKTFTSLAKTLDHGRTVAKTHGYEV